LWLALAQKELSVISVCHLLLVIFVPDMSDTAAPKCTADSANLPFSSLKLVFRLILLLTAPLARPGLMEPISLGSIVLGSTIQSSTQLLPRNHFSVLGSSMGLADVRWEDRLPSIQDSILHPCLRIGIRGGFLHGQAETLVKAKSP
jgi:hypothetical protein